MLMKTKNEKCSNFSSDDNSDNNDNNDNMNNNYHGDIYHQY